MSIAQKTLQIDELLRHVLGALDRTTLLSAARVNKQWSMIALESIWSALSRSALVDFFTEPCHPQLPQPYHPKADVFLVRYAPLVKSLSMKIEDRNSDWEFLYPWLTDTSSRAFTRLRALCISIDGSSFAFSCASRLVARNLTIMELKISHPATSGPSLSQFFSNLGTTTQLQGLSITCPSSAVWRSIRDEVVSCVTNSRFLRDLRLPTCALSPTLVGELVRSKLRGVSYSRYSKVQRGMPTLAHYRGTLDSNDAELIQPLSETPVSTHALEYLTICGTAESIAGIQHRLDLGALRRIDIALVSVSSSRDVRALTELVAAQCPRLTAFSLAAPALDLAAADLPRVAWDDFRALTCLHELQVFQVEWDSAVRIVQTDVEALARAWPALRAFRVCSLRRLQNDLLGAAGLTLAAYLPFAAHCPHIRALDLELAPTLPDEMPKAIPRMAKIEQLMVTVGLPLPGPDRAAAVATFLRALAPREAIQARPPMYIDMLVRELHEPQRLPREWGAAVAQLVRWKESLVDAVKQR